MEIPYYPPYSGLVLLLPAMTHLMFGEIKLCIAYGYYEAKVGTDYKEIMFIAWMTETLP